VIIAGMLVLAASLGWYTQIPVGGHYWPDLLPAYITFALGLAFSFVPVSIAALAQVEPQEAGLASGLINTNQQIGGAIGVALAATIFTSHAKSLLKTGHSPAEAFTSGYQVAFWALLGIALAGAVAAFVLLRGAEVEVPEAEPVQAPV
jgi:MFS family permease